MSKKVFISYSRQDVALVNPVVAILRSSEQLVFLDIDSIPPGTKWRENIERNLTEANLVMVFWCAHSSRSDEVKREYQIALATQKDILPLFLDNTPPRS